MLKGIPGCLFIITGSKSRLKVSEKLTYLGANEYTGLNLLHTMPWEFLTHE